MLCRKCRTAAADHLDERIRMMRGMIRSHAGKEGAEHAVETAETYEDAFQEARLHLVGARLAEE